MLCKHFNDCGGCDRQDKSYSEQIAGKRAALLELFGDIDSRLIGQTIASPEIWFYRNKMEYMAKRFQDKPIIGLRKRKRFNRVVDLEECLIFSPDVKKIFDIFKNWAEDLKVELYDVFKHTGTLKYVALRHGKFRDELMVIPVVAAKPEDLERDKPKYDALIERLKGLPNVKSVYLSINNGIADVAVTDDLRLLWGDESIRERVNGVDYSIKPAAFFQTNSYCCNALYNIVKDEAHACAAGGNALDLFCGSGGITLQVASVFDKVIGVDMSARNIEDAKKNAMANRLDNIEFACADAEVFLNGLKASGRIREFSVIIVDPPRAGLSKKSRAILVESGAGAIIYVSCNAASLKEDLRELTASYKVEKMVPVDMFPHTRHLEIVTVLKRV
jgi:23S rRNA (uracil1939-C5)-methyltransferase